MQFNDESEGDGVSAAQKNAALTNSGAKSTVTTSASRLEAPLDHLPVRIKNAGQKACVNVIGSSGNLVGGK